VKVVEFRDSSPALVPLLYGLENHGSALHVEIFLIVYLIEQGHLLVVGGPMVFHILRSLLMVQFDGVAVGVSYGTSELRSKLDVVSNAIHGMQ
jgi:hypothetical protein